ncbi:hypothetical protein TI39_contig304g00012 [Zymoseptoria brevis]|uniref:2EXR domain-containing protein n=1 Tax=Zymoseptoria brevis TaxID=1047168 RepID=A0A0F4GVI8_9PEZI|nr:hypothetical protein TI39_contig304g00012 [Zymoseptoria brevis]
MHRSPFSKRTMPSLPLRTTQLLNPASVFIDQNKAKNGLPVPDNNDEMALRKKASLQLPPLLRLPPELRNHIYAYVFPTPPATLFTEYPPRENSDYAQSDGFWTKQVRLFPPFLRVNRQLRHETFKIFFSTSIFLLQSPLRSVAYLQALPREFVAAIETIHLDVERERADRNCATTPIPTSSQLHRQETFTEYEPDSKYHKTAKDIVHPLLQVNQQLRHEAYKMCLANAIFRFTAKTALVSFFKALPREFVSAITNIQLAMPYLDRNRHLAKTHWMFVNGRAKKGELLGVGHALGAGGINGLRDDAVKVWALLYPGTNSLEGVWTGDSHMFIG